MKIHKKKEIKTYMLTVLAMVALAVPPAALSEWMKESGKGYVEALSASHSLKKEKQEDGKQEKKSVETLPDEKTFFSMAQGCLKGVGEYLHGFWQSFGYAPSPEENNLAYLFPLEDTAEEEKGGEASQKTAADILLQTVLQKLSRFGPELHQKSAGGELFEELNEKEQNWMYRIYQELNRLPYRTGIRFRFLNGDGTESANYSNTKEILALTNVYSYFHQWDHVQSSEAYALKLWDLSHQYDISVGSVYYCDGCEETDEEETEFTPAQSGTADETKESGQESVRIQETVLQTEGETGGASASVSSQTVGNDAGISETSGQNPAESAAAVPEKKEEPMPAESVSGSVSAPESTSALESVSAPESVSSASAETTQAKETVSAALKEESVSETEGQTETAQPQQKNPEASEENGAAQGNSSGSGTADLSICPGHVDVVVTITITGLNEQKNLFSLAASIQETEEEKTDSANNENGGWTGWTEERQAAARRLASLDWEAKYGLKSEEMSFGKTLTKQELEAHMALLPEDISPERRKLIAFALDSVGKIPYHFGGKASRPSYAGNQFFSVTEPDQMGRTLKGLDCSGWINWVYWSALGTPVARGGTSSLASSGTEIPREELKPGDIAVVPGDEAHVVMFLGWDPATGKMICIHESAGRANNVTVSLSDRAWTHYRRILE